MSKTLECQLCPRACRLREGQRGDCRVRIHLDGKLQTLVYGNPCSVHVDPIEKNLYFMSFHAQKLFLLPPPDAICIVNSAKTGRSRSALRRKHTIMTSPRKESSARLSAPDLKASPTLIPTLSFFMNTCMIPRNLPIKKRC